MDTPCLDSWIERRAAVAPRDVALVFGEERRTYAVFAARILATAALLQRHGVRRGDRVAFHGRNEPAALDTLFAALTLGAVWVPVHPGRPEDEVRFVAQDAGARVLVRGQSDFAPSVACPVIDAGTIAEAPVPAGRAGPATRCAPDDLAVLGYTSGTTGPPKGVMLSHANLTWNVIHMLAACSFSRADIALAGAPLTRVGGLAVTVLETFFVGGTVVIPTALDGASVRATIERERITVLFANPDLLQSMVDTPGWPEANLSTIRTGVVGGGLVPDVLLHRYLERGILLRHGYGLTEGSPVITMLDEHDAVSRSRSVGKAIGFVEARTVHPDGKPCAPGEVGEIAIRGPNVTSGYWRRPDATAAARLPGGWWRTGDAASMDEDGYFTYVDRVGDGIDLAEGRVYPAEVERHLYGTPGLVDAAVGAPHGRLVVAVVPEAGHAPDLADIRRRLQPHLTRWKLPTGLLVVREVPRNATGKIRRASLRDLLERGDEIA